MVTSGVAPAMIMYKLLEASQSSIWLQNTQTIVGSWIPIEDKTINLFPFFGLLLALGAGYRLANFNIDTKQTTSFIGLPTPAMSLVVLSIPLIQNYSTNNFAIQFFENKYVLIFIVILLNLFMNMNVKLFSLKLNNFTFSENKLVFLFLIISLVLILLLQFVAIPIIILLYILMSIIFNYTEKSSEKKR